MYYCTATKLIDPMNYVRGRTKLDHFSLFNYLQRKSICCLHRLKGADLKGVVYSSRFCVPGNFEIVRLFNYFSPRNILLLTLMNGVRSRKVKAIMDPLFYRILIIVRNQERIICSFFFLIRCEQNAFTVLCNKYEHFNSGVNFGKYQTFRSDTLL